MTEKLIVKIIPIVQFRFETTYGDGSTHGYNEKYQKPTVAADHWARHVTSVWARKMIEKHFSRQIHRTEEFYILEDKRREKAYRRVLPIFKRLLNG